ncbi:hypothetical protein BM221_004274 [Beauveria bassiana]|uniref:Uncharacterized protein n=1 Tax=Beauveria bassiana TaxID=176275 RepID=A0A2N6NQS2_BEABA|nr:hypothetical protein BM221_004274 [Beauveria bassiana]
MIVANTHLRKACCATNVVTGGGRQAARHLVGRGAAGRRRSGWRISANVWLRASVKLGDIFGRLFCDNTIMDSATQMSVRGSADSTAADSGSLGICQNATRSSRSRDH